MHASMTDCAINFGRFLLTQGVNINCSSVAGRLFNFPNSVKQTIKRPLTSENILSL